MSDQFKQELIALLPRLRRFALTLTRARADADDLVQDACMLALRSSAKWDRSQPLDRWVFTILRNSWMSELRKRKVRQGAGQVPADETHELVDHHTGEQAVIASELKSQIFALPEDLSSILLLVSVEGFSYAEAAKLLEIPVGTVMSRIHRARKMLAEKVAQSAQEKEGAR